MKLIIILILFSLRLFAPATNTLVIVTGEAIQPYEKLWNVTCFIESSYRPNVIGDSGQSYGIVQIQQVRLDDYFKKTGIRYSLTDCFDVEISKKIWLYYASQFDYRDNKAISKDWNKSKTNRYWNKINHELNKL